MYRQQRKEEKCSESIWNKVLTINTTTQLSDIIVELYFKSQYKYPTNSM